MTNVVTELVGPRVGIGEFVVPPDFEKTGLPTSVSSRKDIWRIVRSWIGPSTTGERTCAVDVEFAQDEALFTLAPPRERPALEDGVLILVRMRVSCSFAPCLHLAKSQISCGNIPARQIANNRHGGRPAEDSGPTRSVVAFRDVLVASPYRTPRIFLQDVADRIGPIVV